MAESKCMRCFSYFDDEEHLPRSMTCGHTMCTKCLKLIKNTIILCPKCNTLISASEVTEYPVNFSLQEMVKSFKNYVLTENQISSAHSSFMLMNQESSEITKAGQLPECPEHQLPMCLRCSTHKAWLCESCLLEDHTSKSCEIITISKKLSNTKSKNLDKSQTFLDIFEESCKRAEECKNQCKNKIKECEDDIVIYKSMITKLEEEIQKKEVFKLEIEERYVIFDQKLNNLRGKRGYYDNAVISLKSSQSNKEVSQCSIDLQYASEQLILISHRIENQVDLMMQTLNINGDHLLGYHELKVRHGVPHLHVLHGKLQEKQWVQVSTPAEQDNSNISNTIISKRSRSNSNSSSNSDSSIINIHGPMNWIFETTPVITEGLTTFIDIAWPGEEPRRVYIEMIGNTDRARQHLRMVTGQCGQSYKGLQFIKPCTLGQPGTLITIHPNDGEWAAPLFKDVTVTDINHKIVTGLVTGVPWKNNKNNALFGIYLSDYNGQYKYSKGSFGLVTSGHDVLKAVANSDARDGIKIVDSGVALCW